MVRCAVFIIALSRIVLTYGHFPNCITSKAISTAEDINFFRFYLHVNISIGFITSGGKRLFTKDHTD